MRLTNQPHQSNEENLESQLKALEQSLLGETPPEPGWDEKKLSGAAAVVAGGVSLATAVPLLGAVAVAALAGGATYKAVDVWNKRDLSRAKRNAINQFRRLNQKWTNDALRRLSYIGTKSVIDFQFVRPSPLYDIPEFEISPPIITDKNVNAICAALLKHNQSQTGRVIKSIDLSNSQLTNIQLKDLMAVGLAKFGTIHLNLSGNDLKPEAIDTLYESLNEDGGFESLESLDLSRNALTGACLKNLVTIVSRVSLKELNLSDNKLSSDDDDYFKLEENRNAFLYNTLFKKNMVMPSLRRLELRNVGIHAQFQNAVKDFFLGQSQLEYVDMRGNPGLRYQGLKALYREHNEFHVNTFLDVLLTDMDEELCTKEILGKLNNEFTRMGYRKSEGGSKLLYMLNHMIEKIEIENGKINWDALEENGIPESISDCLAAGKKVSVDLVYILKEIQRFRQAVLGIAIEHCRIPITEHEYIALLRDILGVFYNGVLSNKEIDKVDPELLEKKTKDRPTVQANLLRRQPLTVAEDIENSRHILARLDHEISERRKTLRSADKGKQPQVSAAAIRPTPAANETVPSGTNRDYMPMLRTTRDPGAGSSSAPRTAATRQHRPNQ